jgi:hypothetical protein
MNENNSVNFYSEIKKILILLDDEMTHYDDDRRMKALEIRADVLHAWAVEKGSRANRWIGGPR